MATDSVIVVAPGEGRLVPRRYGERTVVKAAEAETRGAYAVRENSVPAGFGGVPMHVHREAEEAFYILDGELTVFSEAAVLAVAAGSFAVVPRGVAHSIANRGTTPVRWLTLISPAWASGWVEEEGTDPARQAAAYAKYGLEIVGPPPTL